MAAPTIAQRHRRLLDEVLADDRLTAEEDQAFRDMREKIHLKALSDKQLEWVERTHRRLELDAGKVDNMVSSGAIAPPSQPFEQFAAGIPWGAKAMAPPGRRSA